MNKKALEDLDVQKYKIKKEDKIGNSGMASSIIMWTIVGGLILCLVVFIALFL